MSMSTLTAILDKPLAKLLAIWGFLNLCLAGSGIVTVVASSCFHRPGQLIVNLILDNVHFFCGLALGGSYIFASVVSIPAIWLGRNRLWGLKGLNYLLLVLIGSTLAFASWIWFFSLRQLQELCDIWLVQKPDIQQAIQDQWKCCGYWNGTFEGDFRTLGGYCSDPGFAATQPGCMNIITSAHSPGTDYTLNNIFTCLYGWTAILGAFLLATLCVIKERQVEVRFKRIDGKRGGGGFV